jgi:hypothetical protein
MGLRGIKRMCAVAIAVCAATMAVAGPASAQSTSAFAGVWSFNGGKVGVVKNADKSFTGVVIRATKSGTCVHTVGEKMWTDVRLSNNLSWWGKHVWFLKNPCHLAPSPGNTAWKIFKTPGGKTFLRGCYANWALPTIQPQFVFQNGGWDCSPGQDGAVIDSNYIRPKKSTFKSIARFPKAKCLGKKLKLRFVNPPTDALSTVKVSAGGLTKVLDYRNKLALTLTVSPGSGKVKIKVLARTLLGHTVKGGKTYKTC